MAKMTMEMGHNVSSQDLSPHFSLSETGRDQQVHDGHGDESETHPPNVGFRLG